MYKFKRLHLHIKDQNTNRRRKLKPGNNLLIFTTIPETLRHLVVRALHLLGKKYSLVQLQIMLRATSSKFAYYLLRMSVAKKNPSAADKTNLNTVQSLISGHHWGKRFCPLIGSVHFLESLAFFPSFRKCMYQR